MDRRRFMIVWILGFGACCFDGGALAKSDEMFILDDFSRDDLISTLGTPWRGFSDQVMGGISQETLALTEIAGRRCLRLTGDVRLENNGGFIQMTLDLAPDGRTFDASSYVGVLLTVRGNGEKYGVHLRTPACVPSVETSSSTARGADRPRWSCSTTRSRRSLRCPCWRYFPHPT
jgi:hypothetical protein